MLQTHFFTDVDEVIPRKPDLKDFWNVESIGVIDDTKTPNDEKAKQMFKDTLQFTENLYQVTWPWKEEYPDLPVNHELATGRLRSCVFKNDEQTRSDGEIWGYHTRSVEKRNNWKGKQWCSGLK